MRRERDESGRKRKLRRELLVNSLVLWRNYHDDDKNDGAVVASCRILAVYIILFPVCVQFKL